MSPLAVIEVAFDPALELAGIGVRWQALAIAAALLLAVALAASQVGRSTRMTRPRRDEDPAAADRFPPAPRLSPGPNASRRNSPLRLDDLAYILLAVVPGAVVGGRLVHGVVYWSAYLEDPNRLLDPAVGSLSLLGAVLGGTVSAALMALLLAAPVRRWADVAAIPLLLALGLGKLAQFLGGSGQGAPFDGPWAVAFVGDGPWVSANPAVPAHPSQLYEGIWLLASISLVASLAVSARLRGRPTDGRLFLAALLTFLLGRVLVGFTWRDESVLDILNAEQALALAGLVIIPLVVAGWSLLSDWREARKPVDLTAVWSSREGSDLD